MGKTIVPKYRLEYITQEGKSVVPWTGGVSKKWLEAWRQMMNKSFLHDGINAHVSQAAGFVVAISKIELINQRTNEIVLTVKAPAFETF